MSSEFFNDMQSLWMKNFADVNWFKNTQEQNMHFCGPDCSNMSDHLVNLSKISTHLMQNNFNVALEGLKANLSAQHTQQMLENNKKCLQAIAFNTANYAKQLLAHSADIGVSLYEHMSDAMMENCNLHNPWQAQQNEAKVEPSKSTAKKN